MEIDCDDYLIEDRENFLSFIQTLIGSAISMFLINKKGGSLLPSDQQDEIIKLKDENKTEGIFREMLNWLYSKISELLGLNNYTPINNITNNKKSFENMKQLLLEVSKKVFDLMEKSSSYI
jgi:hypothetical protein